MRSRLAVYRAPDEAIAKDIIVTALACRTAGVSARENIFLAWRLLVYEIRQCTWPAPIRAGEWPRQRNSQLLSKRRRARDYSIPSLLFSWFVSPPSAPPPKTFPRVTDRREGRDPKSL